MSGRSDQRFGGAWTLLKLDLVQQYLGAYTRALHGKFTLEYIDAFAGTGDCVVNLSGQQVRVPGSAQRALAVDPPFDVVSLIEADTAKAAQLQELTADHGRPVQVYAGDANTNVQRLARSTNWRRRRAVLFLDPFGNEVQWSTLQAIANTRAVDVWYLFPLAGLFRNTPHKAEALDPSKVATLTRILGTQAWREAFYEPRRQADLFGVTGDDRHATVDQLEVYAGERLRTLFPTVSAPRRLTYDRGAPAFSLFFMSANPSHKARALATRIAGHILRG